jgi:hypothetical protein
MTSGSIPEALIPFTKLISVDSLKPPENKILFAHFGVNNPVVSESLKGGDHRM